MTYLIECPHTIRLYSTLSFFRNVTDHLFPSKASENEREEIIQLFDRSLSALSPPYSFSLQRANQLTLKERQTLQQAFPRLLEETGEERRGEAFLIESKLEVLGILNGENHLQLLSCSPARLYSPFTLLQKVEDAMQKEISFCFSPQWGFLLAQPQLSGLALQATIVLNLPALFLSGEHKEIEKEDLEFLSYTSFHQEREGRENFLSQPILFLSNQSSQNFSAEELLNLLERRAFELTLRERELREKWKRELPLQIRDQIQRSCGLLAYAEALSFPEAIGHLSLYTLGRQIDLFSRQKPFSLSSLLFHLHEDILQAEESSPASSLKIDQKRARQIREITKSIST